MRPQDIHPSNLPKKLHLDLFLTSKSHESDIYLLRVTTKDPDLRFPAFSTTYSHSYSLKQVELIKRKSASDQFTWNKSPCIVSISHLFWLANLNPILSYSLSRHKLCKSSTPLTDLNYPVRAAATSTLPVPWPKSQNTVFLLSPYLFLARYMSS